MLLIDAHGIAARKNLPITIADSTNAVLATLLF
jgi:hypothetical protein